MINDYKECFQNIWTSPVDFGTNLIDDQKGSDEPAHPCSLIRALIACAQTILGIISMLCLFLFQNSIPFFENSVDQDQLASDEASLSGSTLFNSLSVYDHALME